MKSALIYFGIYLIGCPVALLVFLLGSSPLFSAKSWRWPVIFLWPLLLLWPVYAGLEWFLKWKIRREE